MKKPEEHRGVSSLRQMNTSKLREFAKGSIPMVLHDHAEPIAALVPYNLFMALQSLRTLEKKA